MASSLVHILDKEVLKRKKEKGIKAVGMDLDGNLTDLHKPEIYRLVWENILDFLPDNVKIRLQKFSIQDIIERTNFKLWHFLDMARGYNVIADQNGKILAVKNGSEYLGKKALLKTYGTDKTIDISYPLSPDHNKPRFLPCCDAFDSLECAIKAWVVMLGGYPTKSTLREIDKAFYQVHHSENGFKKFLVKEPEKYGVKGDNHLREFLENIHHYYKTFLLTSSPKGYTMKMVDALGIADYFDAIILNVSKPACFLPNSDENRLLWKSLYKIGIESSSMILYVGDHLYKDSIPASQFGACTCLRAKRTTIDDIERKLRKYANVHFEPNGYFVVPKNNAKEEDVSRLNSTLAQLYRHVDVLTTKVQNLEPLLLH